MKRFFFISLGFLLITINGFSQREGRMVGSTFVNPAKAAKKPLGSTYNQPNFSAARVENLNLQAFMRYNVFKDEFEFITPKNDTLILDKIEDFNTITFIGNKKKYCLTVYTNDSNRLENGYLIELYNKGNFTLYKKENIVFTEEKIAKTTLEKDMPAKYSKASDSYFLKNSATGTTAFPDGKKALTKMFPDKKQAIETFLKENKIDLDKEPDMIKTIDFLAS